MKHKTEYENLINKALTEIPEFRYEYNKAIGEDTIDYDTGVHIVFSFVFVPLVINAVKMNDLELETRLFAFIEEIAESKDKLVSEVVDFTIMEELHDNIPNEKLIPLLAGPESRRSLSCVLGYMD